MLENNGITLSDEKAATWKLTRSSSGNISYIWSDVDTAEGNYTSVPAIAYSDGKYYVGKTAVTKNNGYSIIANGAGQEKGRESGYKLLNGSAQKVSGSAVDTIKPENIDNTVVEFTSREEAEAYYATLTPTTK